MQKGQSIFKRARRHIISQPLLVVIGAVAALGGFLDIIFAHGVNAAVSSLLLLTGLQIAGKVFWIHIIAFVLGFFLGLLFILAISGFAQSILLKVAGAHHHDEEDVWYGALRNGLRSAIPLMWIWTMFYIVSGIFVELIYRLGLVTISAVTSTAAEILISFIAIVLVVFVILLLMVVAMNASCFVSVFRMKTWKAIASGFELFAQIPFLSIGTMLVLAMIWIAFAACVVAAFGIIAFIGVWLAHFVASPDHLASFIVKSSRGGLLNTLLIGILLVTNAALTAFGDTAWALFFLEHVSTGQLPKQDRRTRIAQGLSEAEAV